MTDIYFNEAGKICRIIYDATSASLNSMQPSVAISTCSAIIAFSSLVFTIRSWRETYRPIVTAKIETNSSENVGTTFKIVVCNTGNRPAVDVQLRVQQKTIHNLLQESSSQPMRDEIIACFSDEGIIPLLHSESSVSNGFGMITKEELTMPYGTKIPITIEYKDSSKRKFRTKQIIIYKDSTWFAGSGWEEDEKGENK
jgi:hypothetical protein